MFGSKVDYYKGTDFEREEFMKKKYLALVIVVLLVLVSALAGCKKTEPTETTVPSKGTAESGEKPTTGEPIQLTGITTTQSSETTFPYPIVNDMAAQANLEIIWESYGITDWGTQKSVMLASGDLPDIWYQPSIEDFDAISGLFTDLAPYIDSTVNIKRFFTEVPEAQAFCTNPDGTIYGLPTKHALKPLAGDSMYVNKAWCDTLGIDIPKTLDDYEAMLMAFVTQDPNGDGELNEVGYTGYNVLPFYVPGQELNSMGALQCFFPSFGVLVSQGMSSRGLTQIVDGEVVFAPTMEGFKEALIWLNKLFAEGAIDSELFTLDPPAMMAKLGASEGVMAGAGSAWSKEAFCFGEAVNFEYIAPLIGPDGQQMWRSDYAFSMFGNAGLIAASCEEPQAVMDFFDLCYDEWNSLQICYGYDGIGVSHDDQGNPILIKGPDGETGDAFRFTVSSEMGPGWASPEYEATVGGRDNSDTFLKRDASEFYSEWFVPESRYPVVKWTTEQSEQLSTLQTDINTYVDTALVNFVMNGGVEEGWQDYLDQLDRMGLADLMEIYVAGYEGTMK